MAQKNVNDLPAQAGLEELKTKCEEYLNGWKRERADFLNYKKEEMERIGQFAKYANEELILKIIPILDNICLAESHVPEELIEKDPARLSGDDRGASWVQGFLQIKKQLSDFLQKEGIEAIKTVGEPFDPNLHESVGEIGPSEALAKEGKPGTIVEEIRRGYTLHGKIIRPAKVKISK